MTRLEALATAAHALLNDATVARVMMRVREGQHGQRRRVHWYRVGGEIEYPSQAGGRKNTADTERVPCVWERRELVECVIFAESEDTVEALLESLVTAIDKTAPNGAVAWEGYEWQENEIAQRVPLVRLNFRMRLPVPDEIKPLTELTAVVNTTELDIPT